MDRHRRREDLEFIQHILISLPKSYQKLLKGTHFVTGYDPRFLESYWKMKEKISHCKFLCGQGFLPAHRRHPTIFLDSESVEHREVVLHELGHAFFDLIPEEKLPNSIVAISDYAEGDWYEACATSFQAYFTKHNDHLIEDWENDSYPTKYDLQTFDPKTFAYFKRWEVK